MALPHMSLLLLVLAASWTHFSRDGKNVRIQAKALNTFKAYAHTASAKMPLANTSQWPSLTSVEHQWIEHMYTQSLTGGQRIWISNPMKEE